MMTFNAAILTFSLNVFESFEVILSYRRWYWKQKAKVSHIQEIISRGLGFLSQTLMMQSTTGKGNREPVFFTITSTYKHADILDLRCLPFIFNRSACYYHTAAQLNLFSPENYNFKLLNFTIKLLILLIYRLHLWKTIYTAN